MKLPLSFLIALTLAAPNAPCAGAQGDLLATISVQPKEKYRPGETIEVSATSVSDELLYVYFSVEFDRGDKWVEAGRWLQGREDMTKKQPVIELHPRAVVKDSWALPSDVTAVIGKNLRCRLHVLGTHGKTKGRELGSVYSRTFAIVK